MFFALEESIHVAFDESSPQNSGKGIFSDVSSIIIERLIDNKSSKEDPSPKIKQKDITEDKEERLYEDDTQETSNQLLQDWIITKHHTLHQILGDIIRGVSTRSEVNNFYK